MARKKPEAASAPAATAKLRQRAVPTPEPPPDSAGAFPIVGIGACAGGLEPMTARLRSFPANPHMAFVLVQHLSPGPRQHAERAILKGDGDAGPDGRGRHRRGSGPCLCRSPRPQPASPRGSALSSGSPGFRETHAVDSFFRSLAEHRKTLPNAKVILVPVHGDTTYVNGAFRLGASGYIMKRRAAEVVHDFRAEVGIAGIPTLFRAGF